MFDGANYMRILVAILPLFSSFVSNIDNSIEWRICASIFRLHQIANKWHIICNKSVKTVPIPKYRSDSIPPPFGNRLLQILCNLFSHAIACSGSHQQKNKNALTQKHTFTKMIKHFFSSTFIIITFFLLLFFSATLQFWRSSSKYHRNRFVSRLMDELK